MYVDNDAFVYLDPDAKWAVTFRDDDHLLGSDELVDEFFSGRHDFPD